jgi:hypothetical protein
MALEARPNKITKIVEGVSNLLILQQKLAKTRVKKRKPILMIGF